MFLEKTRSRSIRQQCTIDGCEKPSRSAQSPHCEMHYGRIRFKSSLGLTPSETICRHCGTELKGSRRFYCSDQCLTFGKRKIPISKTYKLAAALVRLPDEDRIWKAVNGFSLYEISNDGLLRRTVSNSNRGSGFLIKPTLNKRGYVQYGLYKNKTERRTFTAHRLVASAFLEKDHEYQNIVLHKNDVKLDCRFFNLKWGTQPDNIEDAKRNQRIRSGDTHPSVIQRWSRPRGECVISSKLKSDQVIDIFNSMETAAELARRYMVDAALIARIRSRKIWRHITDPENFRVEMALLNAPIGDGDSDRCKSFLAALRKCPCLICGATPSEAAHIRMSSAKYNKTNPGVGKKPADKYAVPLCCLDHRTGHDAQHSSGEEQWWMRKGIDPLAIAARLWAARDDLEKMLEICAEARSL